MAWKVDCDDAVGGREVCVLRAEYLGGGSEAVNECYCGLRRGSGIDVE